MSKYLVATGHDVGEVNMSEIAPQPRSRGIQYARREFAADGTPVDEGPFVELEWNVIGNATQFKAILAAFGLLSNSSSQVSVKVRDTEFDWVLRNGTAIKPVPGNGIDWVNYFPRNLVILIRDLEEQAS